MFANDEEISSALETKVRRREISDTQASSVMSGLKGGTFPIFTVTATPDIEAGHFALSIWALLRTATSREQKITFLEKEPNSSGILALGAFACGDGSAESDRVIMALWNSGVVDTYFPVRSPEPGKERDIVLAAPVFCPPNSIFVGRRVAEQDIWMRQK